MAVYFCRFDDAVKIGFAKHVPSRLRAIQTTLPRKLVLLRQVDGGRAVERWLHQHYKARRLHGEWFAYSECMLTIEPPAISETADNKIPEFWTRERIVEFCAPHQPKPATLDKWFVRGKVPARWRCRIYQNAINRGMRHLEGTLEQRAA